jgi:CBS domain-containing protein
MVTAVVAAVFGAVALALPASAPAALRALIDYQAEVNLLILGFNLLPAFPLDGGRVARALLWRHTGDLRAATATAARVGQMFGYLLIAVGVLTAVGGAPGGLWFAVIGVFLVAAANAERLQQQLVTTFTGVPAGELMSRPAVSLPSELTLAEAQSYFARYRYTAFPVTDPTGRAVGMLSVDHLQRTPHSRWAATAAIDRADRDPALLIGEREDVAHLIGQAAFARVGRAAVVDEQGRPVGVVSLTDIQRAIRASRLGGRNTGAAGIASR